LYNPEVYKNLIHDGLLSTVPLYEYLLERTVQIPLFLYIGAYDGIDGPHGIEAWIDTMKWSGLD
jgi:hypothetical protein